MTEADVQRLTYEVLSLGFLIAAAFGWVAQRTHFCTMGAVTDLVITGDWTRMRMWAAAAGVAIVGFNAMVALGWVQAGNSIYAGPRVLWFSALLGGFMFGVGMVLASGCTSRNLQRAGTGNLKAVVVLLVVAFAGFATLKGLTAVIRVGAIDAVGVTLASGQDLPMLVGRLVGASPSVTAGSIGCLIGAALLIGALYSRVNRSAELAIGSVVLGGLVVGAWWVSGVLGFVAENPSTLEPTFLATNSRRMEALSFVASVSYAADYVLFFSDASKVLTIGIVTAAGMVVGAWLHAIFTGTFRWEGFHGVADLGRHLLGGALMGVGGVTALGCTIGQGLSGISTLSVTSFIAVGAMISGAAAAVRWQMWQMERAAGDSSPARVIAATSLDAKTQ